MKDVTIQAKDLTKIYGTPAPLKVRILDDGVPLQNRTLIITINGVDYTRTTDSNGGSSLNINLIPGTYPTTIHFIGDATYNSLSYTVLVRVLNNTTPQKETKQAGNYFEVNKIPLHVIMSSGFDVKTGQNIKETQLLHDDGNYNSPTFYFNSGFDGDEFEVSVVMKESYFYNGEQVMAILNGWNKTNLPVTVVTDSMIVSNGKYTMQITGKSQTLERRSIWKLRFKQYYENSLSFEAMYDRKISTLSSIDQLLLRQVNGVNSKSSGDVITALQYKLQSAGYWDDRIKGYTETHWVGIPSAIGLFQYDVMGVYDRYPAWNGVDYETICALIEYTTGGFNE